MEHGDHLVPVFIPALAPLLEHAEEVKGASLTQEEVHRIRDNATCIMMRAEDASRMAESRGYRDIDPESCWQEWQQLRAELGKEDGDQPANQTSTDSQ